MFSIRKPSLAEIATTLQQASRDQFSYSETGATNGAIPATYTVDRNRVQLGSGQQVFHAATSAIRKWEMFNLGWVRVFRPNTPIETGANVAVLIHHFGLWSLNTSRIVYVLNDERKYGFAYGTLREHAEQGEERFSIEWSLNDDSVSFEILAFSKPRQWQARLGMPIARMLQKKFARDAMAAMKAAVNRAG